MFSLGNETKRLRLALLGLVAGFFLLNLFFALRFGDLNFLGDFQKFNNDDVKYVRSAWELADHGRFIYHRVEEPTVFIMPGLTFTLAFFVRIFGPFGGITAFRVFQAVLQGLSLYLVFLIGRRVFNSRAALVACGLNLLYVAEYYAVTMILTEVLFKFLFLLLIYLCLLAVEEKKLVWYLTGGAVWALACLVRPTVAAFPAVILILWLVRRYTLAEMVRYTLVTSFVFVLVMAPWWIRNYLVFDRFIPLTLSTGNPFLQGTYINYDMTRNYTVYELGKTYLETNAAELAAGLYRLKTYFPQEPLRYIWWYTLGKTRYFWDAPFYWKPMLGFPVYWAELQHYLFLGLGILGGVLGVVRRRPGAGYLVLVIAFTNLMYLPYFTMSRYSYPLMPLVAILGAAFLVEAGMRLGHRKERSVV